MLLDGVLAASEKYLEGLTVSDAVVGVSLMGIQLNNGNIGTAYVLRENLPAGCGVFPYVRGIIGQPAFEIAKWAKTGQDMLKKGLGVAVLTAAAASQSLADDTGDMTFGVPLSKLDTVGMIGYIKPIADEFKRKAKEVIVFDEGISLRGGMKGEVADMNKQAELLPKCDVMIITGTTFINGTIDGLVATCKSAREIVVVGSSTPMFAEAFKGTRVTMLAGSTWNNGKKAEIFKNISLACGISHLSEFMIKKAVKVRTL